MKVRVHLYSQSEPVVIDDVRNAYQKGDMYCVMKMDGSVDKFPLLHIFRVRELPTDGTQGCSGRDGRGCHEKDSED